MIVLSSFFDSLNVGECMTETIVLRDKSSLVPILFYWPSVAVLFVCMMYFPISLVKSIPILQAFFVFVILLIFAASIIRLTWGLVEREFTSLVLTETQLIWDHGVFTRYHTAIQLDRVQSVHIRYPFLGQMLNYGSVIITTAGGPISVRHLPRPKDWEREIQQRTQK